MSLFDWILTKKYGKIRNEALANKDNVTAYEYDWTHCKFPDGESPERHVIISRRGKEIDLESHDLF